MLQMSSPISTNLNGVICEKISVISVKKLSSGFYTHLEKYQL